MGRAYGSPLEGKGNAVQRRFVYLPGETGPRLWYEGSGTATRRYFHQDLRGSMINVTSQAGAPVYSTNSYEEYGRMSGAVSFFGFTGQEAFNFATSFKARFYSAPLGRFLSPDPIGYGAGMNMYGYVRGDPVNGTDPTGLCTIKRQEIDGCGELELPARSERAVKQQEPFFSVPSYDQKPTPCLSVDNCQRRDYFEWLGEYIDPAMSRVQQAASAAFMDIAGRFADKWCEKGSTEGQVRGAEKKFESNVLSSGEGAAAQKAARSAVKNGFIGIGCDIGREIGRGH